jgi:hypothetical protein
VPIRPSIPAPPPAKPHCEITCKAEKTAWDKFKDGAEIIGICLLAVYTWYSIKMYCANRDAANAATSAANTAREALVVGQRAYIVDSFTQKQDGALAKVIVKWENRGETPTRDMTMHMSQSGLRNTPLPDNFDFPNTWEDGKDHGGINVTVPAKGFLNGMEIAIPIVQFQKTPNYLYVWGWAKYRDGFQGTPQHTIRFCEEFGAVVGSSYVHTLETGDACYRHNCIDDDCKP